MAQNVAVDKEIKKADSLIAFCQYHAAQRIADNLYKLLNTTPNRRKYKAQLLEIRYQQAVLLDREEDSSPESLKILLDITDDVEEKGLHELSCKIFTAIALAYEKADALKLENQYLEKAQALYEKYNLENIYSTFCVRRSSYYRYIDKLDSSYHYARLAKIYAKKYDNRKDLADSYMLLKTEMVHNKGDELKYEFLLLRLFLKVNDTVSIAVSYNHIAILYEEYFHDYFKALSYNDSAMIYYPNMPLMYKWETPKVRSAIFESMGKIDSAYYYYKQYHHDIQLLQQVDGSMKTQKLSKEYQNHKKETTIKYKNQQLVFIIILLILITITSILLVRYNRKINRQNKIINKQLGELSKTLEQKQMLLSELQHRVKNNLQHVISILEIQKESVDFNNIEELIRGNQNRIHSMALLHTRLNVSDKVNVIDFKKYVTELSQLVKDSYDNHKKTVKLNLKCEIENMSIEKTLPMGLMIVELVSNSMKHAFKKRNIGIINIEITQTNNGGIRLYYADNGDGFDFNKTNRKGIGQEIIKGLIDQLNGTYETEDKNGFELTVLFD